MYSVFEPRISTKDKLSVIKSLMNNNISGTSPIVEDFELSSANVFDRKYAVSVSNGSVALDLAFQLLGLEEGDEVILPSFTIISCLSAVIRAKAKPIFCDVDASSWNMTFDNVKSKITKKTKAILIVHTYGLVCEAEEILNYCSNNGIYLIEDAAEAHGQSIDGKKCGSFGDISTLSFYANKHITTGEGGLLLTDSNRIYENAKEMRNLGFKMENRFQHKELYWNYRLGGLQAALGLSQIDSLERTIKQKQSQGAYYQELLTILGDKVQLPLSNLNNTKNHYWVYGIVLKKENIRSDLVSNLSSKGIQTRPFFWPLHKQEALKELYDENINLPVSEFLGENGFYIPIGRHLKRKDQEYIATNLIDCINDIY
tara:strand:- start:93 stop:1205 length:1113 start_codon:yes stop_codon:yes gene_type:complete